MIGLNIAMLLVSLFFYFRYGTNSFDRFKASGLYQVASRELHLPVGGNAMTVFYPMDPHLKPPSEKRWWLSYRLNDR